MEKNDLKTAYTQQGPPPLYEDDNVAAAVFEASKDAALKGRYCRHRQLSHLPTILPLTSKQMTAALTLT